MTDIPDNNDCFESNYLTFFLYEHLLQATKI